MSQRGKTLLKGHALIGEGCDVQAYGRTGLIAKWDRSSDRSLAQGGCTCGALSPAGLSKRGRQRWHREHKDALRTEAAR